MVGLSGGYVDPECECTLDTGDSIGLPGGVSPRGVVGDEATFARRAEALVGLPDVPESRRDVVGTSVVRHGEETVDGVSGGRRLPDLDR
jgi:hypothetical protein